MHSDIAGLLFSSVRISRRGFLRPPQTMELARLSSSGTAARVTKQGQMVVTPQPPSTAVVRSRIDHVQPGADDGNEWFTKQPSRRGWISMGPIRRERKVLGGNSRLYSRLWA